MTTQLSTDPFVETILDAEEFAEQARQLGLTVEIKRTQSEASHYRDGSVMLPAVLSVSVSVEIPVPTSLDGTALAMVERCTRLTSYWNKTLSGRSRGRWTLANYSTLGGSKDLRTRRRTEIYLEMMATDLKRLQKLA